MKKLAKRNIKLANTIQAYVGCYYTCENNVAQCTSGNNWSSTVFKVESYLRG
ncbi:hypothetical protein [uncultured Clostridium sp.]|uniref:hypothetical protein n=1 Tax=uncultured Clostridium sp. TaxID=59620 RepID=UPI0028E5D515|nr:hypothetical protein [uncultured Clostridium sp.]